LAIDRKVHGARRRDGDRASVLRTISTVAWVLSCGAAPAFAQGHDAYPAHAVGDALLADAPRWISAGVVGSGESGEDIAVRATPGIRDRRAGSRSAAPVPRATVLRPHDSNARLGAMSRRVADVAAQVHATAVRYDIDPLLMHAIIYVESRFDPGAISRAGARGLMQLMPGTAARFGVDSVGWLHDPLTNVEAGAMYLKQLQQLFGDRLDLVLAAYNAGEGAVARHGGRVPPYAETQAYVRDVLAAYDRLRADARATAGA
jgi:lysozyme